jgi:phage gp36-like protein
VTAYCTPQDLIDRFGLNEVAQLAPRRGFYFSTTIPGGGSNATFIPLPFTEAQALNLIHKLDGAQVAVTMVENPFDPGTSTFVVFASNSTSDRFYEVAQLVDFALVQRACNDAGDMVDGYLRPRHTLPLSAVPTILVKLSAAIARFELHLGGDRQPTEQVRQDRDQAIAFLKDVAAGKADLGITSTGAEPVEDATAVRFKAGSPGVFDADLGAYRWGGPL